MLAITPVVGFGLTVPASATPSETQAVVDALNAQNARIFKVTIISTAVIGFAALLNSYRLLRQLKRDELLFRTSIKKLR